MKRRWFARTLAGASVLLAVIALVWASDRVTLQGERTLYSVDCVGGVWEANHCTGHLAAGPRYAFRVSPRRHEVIHWIRGSDAPSGKYTGCNVQNRDNWSCGVPAGERPLTAIELQDGRPARDVDNGRVPFRDVPKWKWWAIRFGVAFFTDAID